jgi:2-dehydropantoate 2-reductase
MTGAMAEVVAVAAAEGVALSQADIDSWVAVIGQLPPDGEPSMRQDGKARRPSEVELFAGTVRRLGARHGVPTPVNDWLTNRSRPWRPPTEPRSIQPILCTARRVTCPPR